MFSPFFRRAQHSTPSRSWLRVGAAFHAIGDRPAWSQRIAHGLQMSGCGRLFLQPHAVDRFSHQNFQQDEKSTRSCKNVWNPNKIHEKIFGRCLKSEHFLWLPFRSFSQETGARRASHPESGSSASEGPSFPSDYRRAPPWRSHLKNPNLELWDSTMGFHCRISEILIFAVVCHTFWYDSERFA